MSDMIITQNKSSMMVEFNLTKLKDITNRGKRQGFYQVGVIAKERIKENISALPRFGAIGYYKGKRRRASLPGESFANRTKDAMNTLGFDVRGSEYLEFGFRQNAKTIYTKILEENKNRPTLQIASKETVGTAQVLLTQELLKAHEKGFK